MKRQLLAFCSFVILLFASQVFAQSSNSQMMWASMEVASDTAVFTLNLPEAGCLSVYKTYSSTKKERFWGPVYMQKGRFRLRIPLSRIAGGQGYFELFNLSPYAEFETGSRGNGERQFVNPCGLDYDRTKKELLIADTGNDRIVRLSEDGRFLSKHGGFGIILGEHSEEREETLDAPYDVAAGGFSNFYVSDQNNDRICIFDTFRSYKGNLYPEKKARRSQFSRPSGITVDRENNIWIVETGNDRLLKISPYGDKIFELGGFGSGRNRLKRPEQVAISDDGKVYVADTGNGRIAIFDKLGAYMSSLNGDFKNVSAVHPDADGLLWITDATEDKLILCTPAGVKLSEFVSASDGSTFRAPRDLASSEKALFLLDSGNHRIVHFNKNKESTRVSWQAPGDVVE
ncbi:MAG: hypothetical protein GX221_09660 [Candidatus Riflebacteria bacterium]|nr:hypothetical protein [Candidatus Riflebacteria bacterium]